MCVLPNMVAEQGWAAPSLRGDANGERTVVKQEREHEHEHERKQKQRLKQRTAVQIVDVSLLQVGEKDF